MILCVGSELKLLSSKNKVSKLHILNRQITILFFSLHSNIYTYNSTRDSLIIFSTKMQNPIILVKLNKLL